MRRELVELEAQCAEVRAAQAAAQAAYAEVLGYFGETAISTPSGAGTGLLLRLGCGGCAKHATPLPQPPCHLPPATFPCPLPPLPHTPPNSTRRH